MFLLNLLCSRLSTSVCPGRTPYKETEVHDGVELVATDRGISFEIDTSALLAIIVLGLFYPLLLWAAPSRIVQNATCN